MFYCTFAAKIRKFLIQLFEKYDLLYFLLKMACRAHRSESLVNPNDKGTKKQEDIAAFLFAMH